MVFIDCVANIFKIFVISAGWRSARSWLVLTWHITPFEMWIPPYTWVLLKASSLKASCSIKTVSAADFPNRKQNFTHTLCSLLSAIIKIAKLPSRHKKKTHNNNNSQPRLTPHGILLEYCVDLRDLVAHHTTTSSSRTTFKFWSFLGPLPVDKHTAHLIWLQQNLTRFRKFSTSVTCSQRTYTEKLIPFTSSMVEKVLWCILITSATSLIHNGIPTKCTNLFRRDLF